MEQWNQVEELFLAAAELAEPARSVFLERHASPELRREVESLLLYDSSNTQPFAPIIEESAVSMVLGEAMIGRRIGSWRITGTLGHGGMGAVFLANRADEQYQKTVAIKFIRSGLGDHESQADAIDRFRRERQILANFDHPNIARLLDGGTTDEGIPYFVMEYVPGIPIDVWCESRKLGLRQICELFCKVAEAVSYAHRNLVIHRDLKPTNILVTNAGEPMLLDFGIARLVDETAGGEQPGTVLFALTPDYASPEQIRGRASTTSTDVYSLGVVFYRLLTGAPPYKVNSTSVLEIERSVCEQQPVRPSEAAPGRRIPGDLDNIVLMALRKEPERRYRSVEQFGEDVRRYLCGLPVIAREDTVGYRAGKFVARHRLGVLMGTAAALGLVVATLLTAQAARRAEQARVVALEQRSVAIAERERAEREHQIAERERDASVVSSRQATQHAREADFERAKAQKRLTDLLEMGRATLFGIQGTLEHLPGSTNARRDVITTTIKYLDSLYESSSGDLDVAVMLVTGYTQMGDVLGYPGRANLGNTPGAIEAWRKASAILGTLRANELRPRLQAAGLYQRVGVVLQSTGKLPEALVEYRKALALARLLARDFPLDAHAVSQEGIFEHNLFTTLLAMKDPSALEHNRREIEVLERALAIAPGNDEVVLGLAGAYASRGNAHLQMEQLAEAEVEYRRSLALREDLLGRHPNDTISLAGIARLWFRLAIVQGAPWMPNLGKRAASAENAEKGFALYARLAVVDPADRKAKGDYAFALAYAGVLADRPSETGRLRKAIEILDELRAAQPDQATYKADAAFVHEQLGHRLRDAGDAAGAATEYRLSLAAQSHLSAAEALAKLGEK